MKDIAEVLRQHRQRHTSDPGGSDCTCGLWTYRWPQSVDHAAHQAQAVSDAIRELPDRPIIGERMN